MVHMDLVVQAFLKSLRLFRKLETGGQQVKDLPEFLSEFRTSLGNSEPISKHKVKKRT